MPPSEGDHERWIDQPVTRRAFLGTAAGGIVVVVLSPASAAQAVTTARPQVSIGPIGPSSPSTYSFTVRRPEDQCLLGVELINMAPDFTRSKPALVQGSTRFDTLLVVSFAPQSIEEDAYVLSSATVPQPPPPPGQPPPPLPPATTSTGPERPPIGAHLSGGSRLAWLLGSAGERVDPIPFDSAHLLDWTGLILNTVANVVPPGVVPTGNPGPTQPSATETAIELPYQVILSPDASQTFVNATAPVTHGGWTELWHTRLTGTTLQLEVNKHGLAAEFRVVDESDADLRHVRAVWCTDSHFASDLKANFGVGAIEPAHGTPTTNALQYADRYDIVRLSSDFRLADAPRTGADSSGHDVTATFVPTPVSAQRLMLTSLGGWLDVEGSWDLPYVATPVGAAPQTWNTSLLQWRHRATQGRDSYVRVVRKGYLFPYGHRASLITVTERQVSHIADEDTLPSGAYLRQKIYLVLSQPVKEYTPAETWPDPPPSPASVTPPGLPFGGRQFPFATVEALTLVTPDLDAEVAYYHQTNPELAFQPTLGGDPYQLHFRGTDWGGGTFDFRSPVVWVDDTIAYGDTDTTAPTIDKIVDQWRVARPTITFDNARIAVAAPKDPSVSSGDTQLVVQGIVVDAEHADDGPGMLDALILASQPRFYPTLHQLSSAMPEAATLSGNAVEPPTFTYQSDYLATGFDATNPGGVFLATSVPIPNVTFNAANAGGSVTPNLLVSGRSREIGTASGDLGQLRAGTFDPEKVFEGVNAMLLGGLELTAILEQVSFGGGDNSRALQLTTAEQYDADGTVSAVVTTLDWHPTITDGGPFSGVTIFEPTGDPANSFDLHAVVFTDLATPANSTTTVTGQIRDFDIDLFGNSGDTYFLQIPFDSLTFRSRTGQKTDVGVQISQSGVQFQGALSFVQTLADYLSFDGSGLTIDTAGSAITITLTLAIPSIGVGVFALENLAFSAGCSIPYNGDPVRFDFAFCSRENPFQLTVMMFGGGGYVALSIGVDGVETLELGFDFGAGISLDLGVASGQVSLMGGVSFEVATVDDTHTPHAQDVDLTAYVKASGGVSALGVISVSVELYLALSYQDNAGQSSLSGEAEMSIAVHIIFFGFSVSFSVQKTFSGSGATSDGPDAEPLDGPAGRAALAAPADDGTFATNTFGSAMPFDQWTQYCDSFALTGVGT